MTERDGLGCWWRRETAWGNDGGATDTPRRTLRRPAACGREKVLCTDGGVKDVRKSGGVRQGASFVAAHIHVQTAWAAQGQRLWPSAQRKRRERCGGSGAAEAVRRERRGGGGAQRQRRCAPAHKLANGRFGRGRAVDGELLPIAEVRLAPRPELLEAVRHADAQVQEAEAADVGRVGVLEPKEWRARWHVPTQKPPPKRLPPRETPTPERPPLLGQSPQPPRGQGRRGVDVAWGARGCSVCRWRASHPRRYPHESARGVGG